MTRTLKYGVSLLVCAGTLGLSSRAKSRFSHCEEVNVPDKDVKALTNPHLESAINKAKTLIQHVKEEVGSPGMVIGVSVDGQEVWTEGFGYSDVENDVRCTPDTVMRIASISKPITMMLVARLWETGKLDFDKPVQHYVPQFPEKSFDGEKVTITTRHVMSHLSGIRHYNKDVETDHQNESNKTPKNQSSVQKPMGTTEENDNTKGKKKTSELNFQEYYIKDHYKDVSESLDLFKDDPLHVKPGSKFLYTTHGYTLLSAVAEAASSQKFTDMLTRLFVDLGLEHTYLDMNNPLIYHRARFYKRGKNSRLENVPYVDISYKWAGGGLLSDVHDLLRFGNIMLFSYQSKEDNNEAKEIGGAKSLGGFPGYLKQDTVRMLWTPVKNTTVERRGVDISYGMGWEIRDTNQDEYTVYHTGGAVGASSVLMIMPRPNKGKDRPAGKLPQGICVAILTNLQDVGLSNVAQKIGRIFSDL